MHIVAGLVTGEVYRRALAVSVHGCSSGHKRSEQVQWWFLEKCLGAVAVWKSVPLQWELVESVSACFDQWFISVKWESDALVAFNKEVRIGAVAEGEVCKCLGSQQRSVSVQW